jgi:hypothetical protein
MPSMASRMVAIIASLAMAGCSTVAPVNGPRLDEGSAPYRGYPCQDFEFLCVVAVAALVGGIIVATKVHSDEPALASVTP